MCTFYLLWNICVFLSILLVCIIMYALNVPRCVNEFILLYLLFVQCYYVIECTDTKTGLRWAETWLDILPSSKHFNKVFKKFVIYQSFKGGEHACLVNKHSKTSFFFYLPWVSASTLTQGIHIYLSIYLSIYLFPTFYLWNNSCGSLLSQL